jgi:hypothetical protein
MKITVTFELDDYEGDPAHETGLTEGQFDRLMSPGHALPAGAYDIEIERTA